MWIVSGFQTLAILIGILVNDRKMRALIGPLDEMNRDWRVKTNKED